MRLDFIGTHHYNPRHRERVLQAYEELLQRAHGDEPPRFIAVESSEALFAHIRNVERPALRRDVEHEWPRVGGVTWDRLAATIHFEADTHLESHIEAIRDARVIWLDDGDERDVIGIGGRWLNVLRERVRRQPLEMQDESDLESKIAIACAAIDKEQADTDEKKDRDIKFVYRILTEVRPEEAGWAAITVGKVHASDVCDRMRRLLRNAGYDCYDWFSLG